MAENPYTAPQSNLQQVTAEGEATLSRNTVAILGDTGTWVRLTGIVLFAWAIISVFGLTQALDELEKLNGINKEMASTIYTFTIISSIGSTIFFYLIPGVILFRYSSRIAEFSQSSTIPTLTGALESNRYLFKYSGIATIIGISLTFIGVLFIVFNVAAQQARY